MDRTERRKATYRLPNVVMPAPKTRNIGGTATHGSQQETFVCSVSTW
jgi:hypothetical protein